MPGGDECEPERVEPAGDADAVRGAAVVGERVLELLDVAAADEAAALEQVTDRFEQVVAERKVDGPEIDEWDTDLVLKHRRQGMRGGVDESPRHRPSGYIGAVLAPILAGAGHEVVGLDTFYYRDCDFGPEHRQRWRC